MTLAEYQKERKEAMTELKIAQVKLTNAIYWGEDSYELRGHCDELKAFIDELEEKWKKILLKPNDSFPPDFMQQLGEG